VKREEHAPYSESRRMQLRGMVMLAGEVIAHYWPMRTFVHHNPLHGLEYLHFEEAVKIGHEALGGKGYLSNELYREYVRSGRIQPHHIDAALRPLAKDSYVALGARGVTHLEVLRAHLLKGISAPASSSDTLEALLNRHPDRWRMEALAGHIAAQEIRIAQASMAESQEKERQDLGRRCTLSSWCDRTVGSSINEQIDREMIKWCEAFLDEGHAPWPMSGREKGFYLAWKSLAAQEFSICGIKNHRQKITSLSTNAEIAVLEHLAALALPADTWQGYLTFHLTALSGWAGFIKWRAEHPEYEWQQAYPIDLVQYLAVRLWYARELVPKVCEEELGIEGNTTAIIADMEARPHLHFLMRERIAGRLPAEYADEVDRIRNGTGLRGDAGSRLWEGLVERYDREYRPRLESLSRRAGAARLLSLADSLEIAPSLLMDAAPESLRVLLNWLDAFPETDHGPIWLKAFEAGYQEQLIGRLKPNLSALPTIGQDGNRAVRPQAQAIFCIDVRSEPFRRHLEAVGDYETYGFAGFFMAFIRHRALGSHHETDQYPVIVKAKNTVREVPRTYHGKLFSRHQAGTKALHAGHTLLHDLKENVVTPYVMVESLGWFYIAAFIGKTAITRWYRNFMAGIRRIFVPPIATIMTVDKLSKEEVMEMLAAEQRSIIHKALVERFGNRGALVTFECQELLRRRALSDKDAAHQCLHDNPDRQCSITHEEETAFIELLRRRYGINQGGAFTRMERITRIGFTFSEQVFTLETALRMMGLTRDFARLVLICGHGSVSENNPYESALDCGACGGNEGKPNSRILAAIANKPLVREQLAKNGIAIPPDTYFIAGQHNTTTDEVQIFDLEDLPHTHKNDLLRLMSDLREAALRNNQERCARFPEMKANMTPRQASHMVHTKSCDWSQIRPEWGLSSNAAFILGRRDLTRRVNLDGRVFLQSYDYRQDPEGRTLEALMTAPQVVGQWINMEHYFSTVDYEVYGSGSKIYHNVVGRIGIMSGPRSDLRVGLAWQTVMDGSRPYHEPMRLFSLIEAPRKLIDQIIQRHGNLQHYYHNEWVHLVALEPEEKVFYRFVPKEGWKALG